MRNFFFLFVIEIVINLSQNLKSDMTGLAF